MSRRDEPALWRLFDATVRAEYERTLTLATQQIGPLPTAPGGRTALPRLGRVRLRPSSIRASLSIDIAGFSGTTRVFQTQAPPAPRKAGSAAVSLRRRDHASPISGTPPLRTRYTAAKPLVMSLEPAGRRQRTIRSGTQQFVAGHGRRAAVRSQCGYGGFRG
jgi:hypothetical protein